jgi:pimeloyl-ACP methyl ester carboxylesterase
VSEAGPRETRRRDEDAAPAPSVLRFTTDDGLTLVADAWGDPARPPVLLLHGGGQTRHAWGGTARSLAASGRYAVSLDLRGHGESGWAPDANYALGRFARDAIGVAAALPARPAVVGASLGGLSALLALAGEEEPFSALVLVDITPRMERQGAENILAFMRDRVLEGYASLEEAADAIARYLPHRRRPSDLSGLSKNLRRGEDGRWRWHWDPQFVLGPHRPGSDLSPLRLDATVRRLSLPTLLVRGRMSELVSEEAARAFLEQVPHARYADVSGAGHMVAGDRNDAFTEAVLHFLGGPPSDTP